jgi:hypothetical protein
MMLQRRLYIYGLHLPDHALQRIYYTDAQRVLGGVAKRP